MAELPDLSDPLIFGFVTLLFMLVVIGRYFLIAGLFHLWFYVWNKEKWHSRNLGKKAVNRKQFLAEIRWSMITSFIFAIAGAFTALLWQNGHTKIYTDVAAFGWWYLPVSLLASMIIHETYYYWLHRWMHRPKVFKLLHKVHHDSNTTSAWTAFSFHPLEGLLQSLILPLIILVLPMHVYVLLLQLTIMTFSSVINHLEIEVYPQGFSRHWLGRWLIGATHHSLHHKQFRYNYGLYFTFWDKLKDTESPNYLPLFEEKTTGVK
ncbi:sterol desaturase family protein [Aridibaculum aurantiacum]|uniref:sterol desaturase family protein n=1 Tax=Aridibaculum aurantiacum TaxID=2810307 RepID=UPI001F604B50|nr:sterol desaturase family protein [Aridibaculum aurantiacum]